MIRNLLIVGMGSIGKRHYENAKNIPTIKPKLISFSQSVRERTLYDEIRNTDFVIICTRSEIRLEILDICNDLNKPVLIEKPIITSNAEFQHLLTYKESFLEKCMVGYMLRYNPLIKYLSKILQDVDIYYFNLNIGKDVRTWRPKPWDFKESYSNNKKSGGVIYDLCHEIDIAQQLIKFSNIQFNGSLFHTNLNLPFSTDIIVNNDSSYGLIHLDYINPISTRKYFFHSINTTIECDILTGELIISDKKGRHERKFDIDRNHMYVKLLEAFIDYQYSSEEYSSSLKSNLTTTEMIINIHNTTRKIGYLKNFEL